MVHSVSCSPVSPKHQLHSLTCCLEPQNGPYWLLKASWGKEASGSCATEGSRLEGLLQVASLEVVLGRGGEEGMSPGATGEAWPGGLCAALGPPHALYPIVFPALLAPLVTSWAPQGWADPSPDLSLPLLVRMFSVCCRDGFPS